MMEPSDHLFRREARRMVATLTRLARNAMEREFLEQRIFRVQQYRSQE